MGKFRVGHFGRIRSRFLTAAFTLLLFWHTRSVSDFMLSLASPMATQQNKNATRPKPSRGYLPNLAVRKTQDYAPESVIPICGIHLEAFTKSVVAGRRSPPTAQCD